MKVFEQKVIGSKHPSVGNPRCWPHNGRAFTFRIPTNDPECFWQHTHYVAHIKDLHDNDCAIYQHYGNSISHGHRKWGLCWDALHKRGYPYLGDYEGEPNGLSDWLHKRIGSQDYPHPPKPLRPISKKHLEW